MGGGRQTERLNSKLLILKDSSVMSIWTYLTASPCYTTDTNKHDHITQREREEEGGGRDRAQREKDRQTDRDREGKISKTLFYRFSQI